MVVMQPEKASFKRMNLSVDLIKTHGHTVRAIQTQTDGQQVCNRLAAIQTQTDGQQVC